MWNNWEQLSCVAHSPQIVGKTIALLFSMKTCFVQIQSVQLNFACTKRLHNLSTETIINVRNARLCARCGIFLLKFKQRCFCLSFGQGVYIFEQSPKSIQDVFGDVYCPGKFCSNREKCVPLGGYVTTPRSFYGCGKCGAWLFVHKVSLMLQEHAKTTTTDKARFFMTRNRWTWYPTKNCYLMSHLNQPNKGRETCVWTTKYKRLLEMCIVQHVQMKSVLIFQPIKRLVSTTVKKAKPATTFWIIILWTKNRQLSCLAAMVHIVLQERRLWTSKKKNHLNF